MQRKSFYLVKKETMLQPIPFHLSLVRGGIGKNYVVKHYRKKIVITKFPDMTGIIASKGQKKCRKVFKDAVAYAKAIIYNDEQKKMLLERVGSGRNLFNAAIKEYMKKVKPEKTKPCTITNKRDIKIYKPSKRNPNVPDVKRYPSVLFYYNARSGKLKSNRIRYFKLKSLFVLSYFIFTFCLLI